MAGMMIDRFNNEMKHFFCSWSGGKDSCLALFRMIKAGHLCKKLFTMIDETGKRSRSHGISIDHLQLHSGFMNIPLRTAVASWNSYEDVFRENLRLIKDSGIDDGVFGDIDLLSHRQWVEMVCEENGIKPHFPLWLEDRKKLMTEFIDQGFKALIIVINTKMTPIRFLGRQIDYELIDEMESVGIDPCGENGEYHSFVYDGPLFLNPVPYKTGKIRYLNEYWSLNLNQTRN